jgi:Yip1 domain
MTEIGTPEVSPSGEAAATPGLTQGQRVVNTFVAPSKTFNDIFRSQSWWLPFLISAIMSYAFVFTLQKQIGWDTVAANSIKQDPKSAERMANAPAASQEQIMKITTASIQYGMYASPIIILISAAIIALVWWGTINFLFGGRATFGRVFTMWLYAGLPLQLLYILAIITLFAGMDKEAFNINNPAGTNVGFYLPTETPQWLMKFATSLDVFWIWSMVLGGIGLAIVAKVKRSAGLTAVFGWWFLIQIVKVVYTLITG